MAVFNNIKNKLQTVAVMTLLAIVVALMMVITPLIVLAGNNILLPANVVYGNDNQEELSLTQSNDLTYTEIWDGRGSDSEKCELGNDNLRPATGWIHWVFNTKGDSTDAQLVFGGSGNGTYEPGHPLDAEAWHFYTPYFELDKLEATIYLYGGEEGPGGGLVISDFCPAVEVAEPLLTIVKELQDAVQEEITDSNVEFTVILNGGDFVNEEVAFSVNTPAVLDHTDGLELGVEYTVEEVVHGDYDFVSINPSSFTLTEENNEITVTVVNRETESGSIIIEKLIKLNVTDEEVIPYNRTFYFNIYDDQAEELVRANVEVVVTGGEGSAVVSNLPLSVYRVEEVVDPAYRAVLDPADGIVDLTDAENNTVTIIITNTPQPILIIEKTLLDEEDEEIVNSNVEFSVIIDGANFDEEEINFSVNNPATLQLADGLEFDQEYTIKENVPSGYEFVGMADGTITIVPPDSILTVTLTDDQNLITITVTNRLIPPAPAEEEEVEVVIVPVEPEVVPEEELVIVVPGEPEVVPEEEEVVIVVPVEPEVVPEEEVVIVPVQPEVVPEEEEEAVIIITPEAPLATPATGGGTLSALLAAGAALTGSGLLLRKRKVK